jgi:hypothetical protein
MLPVKSEIKSVRVSYVETRPKTIKIPSFKIPVQNLKIAGIFLLLLCIAFVSTSFNPPVVEERDLTVTIKSSEIVEASVLPNIFVPKNKPLTIPITDIIKDKKVLDFLCKNEMIKRAKEVQDKTGLSVATILAQKGVESNWGRSSLTNKTRNNGNIKCKCNWSKELRAQHNKTGFCIQAWDKKEKSNHYYVSLKTNYEGWRLYRDLIYKRYMKAAKQDNIYSQIVWLKKQRYATDKNYVSVVWSVVNQYNLIKLQEYIDKGYTITTTNGKYKLIEQ